MEPDLCMRGTMLVQTLHLNTGPSYLFINGSS